MTQNTAKKVALIGTGLIGQGWAILFANAGYEVGLFDVDPSRVSQALQSISDNLGLMVKEGLVDNADITQSRLKPFTRIEEAVADTFYVQESVNEDLDIKRNVFEQLGRISAPEAILASSCSTIPPEDFIKNVKNRERCLIAHPFSPPHLIPIVEIVETRWTLADVTARTRALMFEIGQRPVDIHKPVVGFAVNRLQAVVINEALRMVDEGVISPEDMDLCMSNGLGLRWAFLGPFETMELNAHNGFMDYTTKFGSVYRAILDDVDVTTPWSMAAIEKVEAWRRQLLPTSDDVTERRLWRDYNLMKLARLFRGDRTGSEPQEISKNKGSAR